MLISLIVAMSQNRIIGKDNQLPWHLPNDLKHFKKITLGKPIIMGRKTYDSIGRPLPDRQNLVISRSKVAIPGCDVVHTLEQSLVLTRDHEEVMIIGGAQVFEQVLPLAHRMYLTFIDAEFEGDVFFPEWNEAEWVERESFLHSPDERNKYHYRFVTLERTPDHR